MTNGLPLRALYAKPLQSALITTINDLTKRSVILPPTLVTGQQTLNLIKNESLVQLTWCGS